LTIDDGVDKPVMRFVAKPTPTTSLRSCRESSVGVSAGSGTAFDFSGSHRRDHVRGNVKTGHAIAGIAIKVHQELALTQVANKAIGKGGFPIPHLQSSTVVG
jgi:hypothetical protein